MTSPVGHALGGYIAAGRFCNNKSRPDTTLRSVVGSLALIVFAANAADLDFIYGAIRGDFNGYHHGASHSIGAVVIFTLLVYWLSKAFKLDAVKNTVMAALAYISHLALDLVTNDTAAPYGMKLAWPFSEQYMIAPQTFFYKITHGGMSDTLWASMQSIFSMHNLGAVGFELLTLGPIALFLYWRRNKIVS